MNLTARRLLSLSAIGIALIQFSFVDAFADEPTLQFNRDIRPILFDQCLACHGPDSASRKGDLRLDLREAAIERKAISPGSPDKSELIARIESTDPDLMMPPPSSNKALTPEQKEILKRWVKQGAEYQPHWAFIPPVKHPIPAVKNTAWVKNPIDAFVLAKLEASGLSPAPEADRATLARRLSLDLTGLPPAAEVVDKFLADQSPNAYEKLVDKFLESDKWGEHRGRYWLDASRYADTHGIHFDNFREMWSYRDNVIAAFNRNTPFDQFTIEQLAGDLLPNRNLDQQIASGFNRCNITTNEGGAIAEEYLVLYDRDRTETVSQVWLGLTAGCAVCHNHKFDPFSQREFYELAAFFNNTTQNAMDGNIKDTPPTVIVPKSDDRSRYEALIPEIDQMRRTVESRRNEARPEFDQWLASANPESLGPDLTISDLVLHVPLNEGQGKVAKATINGKPSDLALSESTTWTDAPSSKALQLQGGAAEVAEVGDIDKDQKMTIAAWVKLQPNDSTGVIAARMESPEKGYQGWDLWVQGRRIGSHFVSQWPNDAFKVISQKQIKANEWTHVALTFDGSGKPTGVKIYFNGVQQPTNTENDNLKGSIRNSVPFRIGERSKGDPISGAGIVDLRLYKRDLSPSEVDGLFKGSRLTAVLAKAATDRSDAEKNDLYNWWLNAIDPSYRERSSKLASLEAEQNAIKQRGTVGLVMNEKNEEAMAYVLYRGEYDKRRDQVKPNTPAVLPVFPTSSPRNRLGLAQWLLEPNHPLTSRVTVNRFWQEVFGTGIVKTSGDFGIAGELPSNQELLDWLAIEFQHGCPDLKWPTEATTVRPWDVKRFFRLLVTSNTYRQSAATTPEKLEKDPHNRLMSRGPRFRMDAEMVRDYALAASGLLVDKIGGPSVKPYQPDGVWEAVAMKESNTHDYKRDSGENLYRRSMYTFWKRSAPPASMEIFNATARETCTVRRERTNTPLQALVTLNDTQFIEAARHLAQNAILSKTASDDSARCQLIAKQLIARPFRPEEIRIVQASLADFERYFQAHPEDAQKLIQEGESKPSPEVKPEKLAAWTMLVNELMNLDEVLNK